MLCFRVYSGVVNLRFHSFRDWVVNSDGKVAKKIVFRIGLSEMPVSLNFFLNFQAADFLFSGSSDSPTPTNARSAQVTRVAFVIGLTGQVVNSSLNT